MAKKAKKAEVRECLRDNLHLIVKDWDERNPDIPAAVEAEIGDYQRLIVEAEQRAEAAEQRVKELAECLKWIAAEVPRPGLYHGGETYYALNQRIAQRAKDALSS